MSVPSYASDLSEKAPKIGVLIVEIMKTKTSTQTIIDGFPVILTTLSVAAMPRIEPKREKVEIQQAYFTSRKPFRKLIKHVLIVETSTRNMPVAPETLGWTPKLNNAGL